MKPRGKFDIQILADRFAYRIVDFHHIRNMTSFIDNTSSTTKNKFSILQNSYSDSRMY